MFMFYPILALSPWDCYIVQKKCLNIFLGRIAFIFIRKCHKITFKAKVNNKKKKKKYCPDFISQCVM